MSCLRRLWVLNQKFPRKCYFYACKRQLYSSSSLGIDTFLQQKDKVLELTPNPEVFKERLKKVCYGDYGKMIFLDDIKKLVKIAETDEDLRLLIDTIKKYNKQEGVVFQNYHFGPEVMRLLYLKNKYKEALMLINDFELAKYFRHTITVILLLDLLFENKKYEEMVNFYKNSFEFPGIYQSQNIILLLLAACYKMNTEECFELAYAAHKRCSKRQSRPPLRNSLVFAALAIQQNKPSFAIETFGMKPVNSLVENYKLIAFSQAKRFDHALEILQTILDNSSRNFFLTNEALSLTENGIRSFGEEYISEFQKLKEELRAKTLIVNEALDKFLFEGIELNYPRKDLP